MWRHKIWFKNNSKICCNNTHSPEPYYFPIPLKDSCLSLGIGATSVEREREREREIGRARGRVCTCSWTMVCKVRWTSLAIPLASPQTYKYAPCETRLQKCAACTWTRIVDAVRNNMLNLTNSNLTCFLPLLTWSIILCWTYSFCGPSRENATISSESTPCSTKLFSSSS